MTTNDKTREALTPAQQWKYKYVTDIPARISFEAWMSARGAPVTMEGDGTYSGPLTAQNDWCVWRAALAITPAQPPAEGADAAVCEALAQKGWQCVECPACGSSTARGYPRPPVLTASYPLADALYRAGYEDRDRGRDCDPRNREECQSVVDAISPPSAADSAQKGGSS